MNQLNYACSRVRPGRFWTQLRLNLSVLGGGQRNPKPIADINRLSWFRVRVGISRFVGHRNLKNVLKYCERLCPRPPFYRMLGQTHVNGWSRVIAFQNEGLTSYIFPFRLRVLQWSRHLFNYWDK